MGQPRRIRKSYSRPFKHWDTERIKEEVRLVDKYGLKNKKEILRAQATIRKFRTIARKILSLPEEEQNKIMKL